MNIELKTAYPNLIQITTACYFAIEEKSAIKFCYVQQNHNAMALYTENILLFVHSEIQRLQMLS